MAQKGLKKGYAIDLLIIGLSWIVFYGIAGICYMLLPIDFAGMPLLLQTLFGAIIEFGVMGFGVTLVCFIRGESFASFGLKKEKLLTTVLLSALVCLPSFLFLVLNNTGITYFPFQGVNFTIPILASGFPFNVLGMLIIIGVWGFFEGFTYVVLYYRLNKIFPAKNRFLNWGAIICGIFCLLIHILVGQSYGVDALGTFVLIYGMLLVYQHTGNAWGPVLIYCFYWNAFRFV